MYPWTVTEHDLEKYGSFADFACFCKWMRRRIRLCTEKGAPNFWNHLTVEQKACLYESFRITVEPWMAKKEARAGSRPQSRANLRRTSS